MLHLVGQTGGVAGAAGHGAGQQEVSVVLGAPWVAELGDLLVDQGGQRRREQDRVAVEGDEGVLSVAVELVSGEFDDPCQRQGVEADQGADMMRMGRGRPVSVRQRRSSA
ncbi:hypothetical protein [Streptomyces sp. NPDC097610]|uniref:hypothetical protein n=1 Tax=Streptomyces sp. NPDC097610 TaxID=3157227 RepID=UPI00332E448F